MYKIYNKKHKTYKNKVAKYNMLAYTPFIHKSGLTTVYEKNKQGPLKKLYRIWLFFQK